MVNFYEELTEEEKKYLKVTGKHLRHLSDNENLKFVCKKCGVERAGSEPVSCGHQASDFRLEIRLTGDAAGNAA